MSYLQNFKYELNGQEGAPRLVLLHGVMGSLANWRKVVTEFSKAYRVLTFDQRGHGWSFKPTSGYAPEDYALDLKLILDELNWPKIKLIGHSMGGRNALHFANKFPQRLEALVIEDIGPEGNPQAMQKTIRLVEMVPVPFQDKMSAKRYFEGEFFERLGGTKGAKIMSQYFYTNIETKEDGRADWRFAREAILTSLRSGHEKSRWNEVRDLLVPTLFIRGDRSVDFSRDEFERVLQVNPQIKGVEIPDSGHWVHFDQPEAFTEVILDFFNGLSTGG